MSKFLAAGLGSAMLVAAATVGGSSATAQTVAFPLSSWIGSSNGAALLSALPLSALVAMQSFDAPLDSEMHCLASAVYFEARGESLEGQMAVAEVVINRARSGRYPSSWCGVVKQRAQFSFVRGGRLPAADRSSDAWTNARAIARLAGSGIGERIADDVLWYHADYVAPRWRMNLNRATRIGTHIFYRA